MANLLTQDKVKKLYNLQFFIRYWFFHKKLKNALDIYGFDYLYYNIPPLK